MGSWHLDRTTDGNISIECAIVFIVSHAPGDISEEHPVFLCLENTQLVIASKFWTTNPKCFTLYPNWALLGVQNLDLGGVVGICFCRPRSRQADGDLHAQTKLKKIASSAHDIPKSDYIPAVMRELWAIGSQANISIPLLRMLFLTTMSNTCYDIT